jgi:steroid 5-alpha reductase family enzyme
MPSFIDRLQKDAHKSELDHTNTTPVFFAMLSAIQLPVTQAIAAQFSTRFQMQAAFGIASHWFGFAFAETLGTDHYFDLTEDVAIFGMITWSYLHIEGEPTLRQQLVHFCALLWVVRLACFVFYRIAVRGADWRFDKLMNASEYNLFGWTSGGTWCFINCFCIWSVAESPHASNPLDLLDYAGLCIFALGFLVEIVADQQKYMFNQKYASGTNKKWIDTGLWKFSRHPNYFGEMTLWLGLSMLSIGGLGSKQSPTLTWPALMVASISPIWSFFFLLFTSLMLLEKRADTKWGGQEAYELYKERTPLLMPLLVHKCVWICAAWSLVVALF